MEDSRLFEYYGNESTTFFEFIRQLKSKASQIQTAILDNIGFNRENIPWAVQDTEIIYIDNIITQLAMALSECSNLQRLILSDTYLQANIENDDYEQLAKVFNKLQELNYICLAGLLKQQKENNSNTRFFYFAMSACQYLTDLKLENNDASTWEPSMWKELGKLFNGLKKLSSFSINEEAFSDECLQDFCEAIKGITNKSLETFSIEWQDCPSTEGLEILGDAISAMPALNTLHLGVFDDTNLHEAISLLKKCQGLKKVSLFILEPSAKILDSLRDALIELKLDLFVLRLDGQFMEEEECQAIIRNLENDPFWPPHEVEIVGSIDETEVSLKKSSPRVESELFSHTPGRTPPHLRKLLTSIKTRQQQQKLETSPKKQIDLLANFSVFNTTSTDDLPSDPAKQLHFPETIHDATIHFIQQLSVDFESSTKFVAAVNGILPLIEELLEPHTLKVMGTAVFHAEFKYESRAEKKTRLALSKSLTEMHYKKALLHDSQIGRIETQFQDLGQSIVHHESPDLSPTPILRKQKPQNFAAQSPKLDKLEKSDNDKDKNQPQESEQKKNVTLVAPEAPKSPKPEEQEASEESSLSSSHNKSKEDHAPKHSNCDESIGSDDYENRLQYIFSKSKDISGILKIITKLSDYAKYSKTKKNEIEDFIQRLMRADSDTAFIEHLSDSLDQFDDRNENPLLKNTGSGLYWFSNIFNKKHVNPIANEKKIKGYKRYSNSSTEDLLIELYEAAREVSPGEEAVL